MGQSKPEPHQTKHHPHKLRKIILGVVSRGLTNAGWVAISHFLWVSYSEAGIFLSILALFCAPALEALTIAMSRKKIALVIFVWSISTTGWLSLMYFMWLLINPVGIFLSAVLIFSGDIIDIYLFLS
jgi:hypothetical protein